MKKFMLLLIFLELASLAIYAQDTIVRTNGEIISCKIQKEDSTTIFFKRKFRGEYINTFINKSEVESVRKCPMLKFNDRDLVLKLDLLIPALGVEARMFNYGTFLISYQPGYVWIKHNDDPSRTYIVSQFRGSTRFFYNINTRNELKKRTDKFAGDFLSISAIYGLDSPITPPYLTIGPTWGIQRNWGGFVHFSVEVGLGFTAVHSEAISPIAVMTDVKLGFAL